MKYRYGIAFFFKWIGALCLKLFSGKALDFIKKFFISFLVFYKFISCVSLANAEFRVCNATQNIVGVAIGYRDKVSWHSEGWWRINPTHCETLLEAPLESRYYYLHVEDIGNDGEWRGNIPMCVKDEEFLINGTENCYVRGYQKAIFQEFDTGAQTRWTVQLTDGKMIKEVKSKRSLEESAR